jgi:AraC family cel operon transcriptional repressor
VWIRPDDAHGFVSDESGVVVHNVAFAPRWFDGFRRRHFQGDSTFWSGDAPLPQHLNLGPSQLGRLALEFAELGRSDSGPRAAERFLLNVLHVATPEPPGVADPEAASAPAGPPRAAAPPWLERALRAWSEPVEWAGGTRRLARLAGRSEEHVARVVRSTTGRCPTDILNDHRMRHAAHLLAATDRKVIDIALECGCSSLGHFYALFQARHRCAPVEYRRRQPPRPV